VAGVAAGSGTRLISNAIEGRPIGEGVLTSAVISGITGGLAGTAGATIGSGVRHIATGFGKAAVHTVGGATISASSGAFGVMLLNVS
jgi:hypothetical protein